MRKRPLELKFRLSYEEYDTLNRKLQEANTSRNAFLVRLITGAKVYPKESLATLNAQFEKANRELRGISTNINQMAKVSNATRTAPSDSLLLDMAQDIMMLRSEMSSLWEEVRKALWQS